MKSSDRRLVPGHIIIACTAAKLSVPAAAERLYTGPIWQTWRTHRPNHNHGAMLYGPLPNGWRIWALSGLHGLLPACQVIKPYDHRPKRRQVDALAALVAEQWNGSVAASVVMVGGQLYQEVANRARLNVVQRIDGSGPDGGRLTGCGSSYPSQEPQPIGDHQQRGSHICRDGHP